MPPQIVDETYLSAAKSTTTNSMRTYPQSQHPQHHRNNNDGGSNDNNDRRHHQQQRRNKLKARSSDLDFQALEIEQGRMNNGTPFHDDEDDTNPSLPSSPSHSSTSSTNSSNWHLFLLFVSATMYSVMGCFVKLATTYQPTMLSTQIVMYRGIFQFTIVVLSMCYFTPTPTMTNPSNNEHPDDDRNQNIEYSQVPTKTDSTSSFSDDDDDDDFNMDKNHNKMNLDSLADDTSTSTNPITKLLQQQQQQSHYYPRPRPLICYNPFGPPNLYKIVIIRGMVGGCGFCFYYYTISALPLGDAITVLSLNPVVTVILASIVLQEPITTSKIMAATCSVIGALLMARPTFLFGITDSDSTDHNNETINTTIDNDSTTIDTMVPTNDDNIINNFGYVTGLLGACCGACVYILIRKAGKKGVHTLNMLFSWCVFGLIISTCIVLVSSSSFVPPERQTKIYIVGACLSGTTAHFLLNYSARMTPAGIASIIRSSGIIWSYMLEVFVFHQIPSTLTIIGVALIGLSLAVVAIDKQRSSNS